MTNAAHLTSRPWKNIILLISITCFKVPILSIVGKMVCLEAMDSEDTRSVETTETATDLPCNINRNLGFRNHFLGLKDWI